MKEVRGDGTSEEQTLLRPPSEGEQELRVAFTKIKMPFWQPTGVHCISSECEMSREVLQRRNGAVSDVATDRLPVIIARKCSVSRIQLTGPQGLEHSQCRPLPALEDIQEPRLWYMLSRYVLIQVIVL